MTCGLSQRTSEHPLSSPRFSSLVPMSTTSVLEVLKDELQYNPQLAVQSIQRLLVIGRALGPDRVHSQLLPYLTSEIQQGNLTAEVLYSIAEVLDQLVEFVASPDDGRNLLQPLRELCCVEEKAVREQAVRAVRAIGRQLPAMVLAPQLVPMVLDLGAQGDWFTPRVSACGMLPLAVALSLRVEAGGIAASTPAGTPMSSGTPMPCSTWSAFDTGSMPSTPPPPSGLLAATTLAVQPAHVLVPPIYAVNGHGCRRRPPLVR